MTRFKVGDRVRKIGEPSVAGVVTSVDDRRGHGTEYVRINGEEYGFSHEYWEYDTSASELAELRAWRDAAIAKHPDLGPVDPDLIEARSVAAKCWRSDGRDFGGVMLATGMENGECDDLWYFKPVIAAIKRGREIERALLDNPY